MVAKTQTIEGYTSLAKKEADGSKSLHYVFWDLEDCTLIEAMETLRKVKHKYGLGIIYILSDKVRSYRAWCFSKVLFTTLLKILLDTDFVDWNFFYYTVRRGSATLRISSKQGRPSQRIVGKITDWNDIEKELPDSMQKVVYDTGTSKRGIVLQEVF